MTQQLLQEAAEAVALWYDTEKSKSQINLLLTNCGKDIQDRKQQKKSTGVKEQEEKS